MRFRVSATLIVALSALACADQEVRAVATRAEPAAPRAVVTDSLLDPRTRAAVDALPGVGGWPRREEFVSHVRSQGSPGTIVECRNGILHSAEDAEELGPIMMGERVDGWRMLVSRNAGFGHHWAMQATSGAVRFRRGDELIECHDPTTTVVQAAQPLQGAFAYAEVLTTPVEPTFVPTKTSDAAMAAALPAGDWSDERVRVLLELGPPSTDRVWTSALNWAVGAEKIELEYELRRRYRPRARCGQDRRPRDAASDLVRACGAAANPRCQLEVLYHRLWNSEEHPFDYETLRVAPLDWDLVFLGRVVDYDDSVYRPMSFPPAEWVFDLDAVERTLSDWLVRADVDPWNRHRITLTILTLRLSRHPSSFEHLPERFEFVGREVAKLPGVPHATATLLAKLD